MKRLFLLGFIFTCFAAGANAQLCGTYTTTLIVNDELGRAVDNAEIKIVPLREKDDTLGYNFVRDLQDASKFSITFPEGYQVKGNHKIIVSAPGFLVLERETIFPHCEKQKIEIRLEKGFTPDQSFLSGTVYDANGAVIPNTKITAVNEKGEKFEARTDEIGEYELKLPYYEYRAEFNFKIAKYEITGDAPPGFERLVLKDFKFVGKYNGKMRLDFAVDAAASSHEPCGPGGGCTTPMETKPAKISNNISPQPLEELPKEQNKTKRKRKIINK